MKRNAPEREAAVIIASVYSLAFIAFMLAGGCVTTPPTDSKQPVVINQYSLMHLNFAPRLEAQVRLGGSRADPYVDVENRLGPNSTQQKDLPIDFKPSAPTDVKVTK